MLKNKTWKSVSKFRLFTMIGLSILTSLSLSVTNDMWQKRDIIMAILQAGIVAFAYLQCPTIPKETAKKEEKQGD